MRRTSAAWGILLLPLLVATASCDDHRVALIRGHIVGVKGDIIAVVPLNGHGSAQPLELRINQEKTTILARRVQSGTMNLERGVRSDLVVGREVAVTIYGRQASIIRVFPPEPVGGHVVKIEAEKLTISLDNGDPNRLKGAAQFAITRQTEILVKTIDVTALSPAHLDELKPGRRVFVYAQGGDAVAVKIVPEPPIIGSVVRIDGDSIVIGRADKGWGIAETTIPYRPSSARAIVQYFGTDVTAPASLNDVKPGVRAAVYVGEGGTVAVKFVSTPVRGRLIAVDVNAITLQARDRSIGRQRYRIVPDRTIVIVPNPTEKVRRDGGRSRENFTFAAGTINDLRLGQQIILSAANDVAIAVRVIPVPATRSQDSPVVTESQPQ